MKQLRLTDDARADLVDIHRYTVEKFGKEQAQRYQSLLQAGFKALRRHPEIGFAVDDVRAGFRCFQIEVHRVFYTLTKDSINVLAILHESQLPTRHLAGRPKPDEA